MEEDTSAVSCFLCSKSPISVGKDSTGIGKCLGLFHSLLQIPLDESLSYLSAATKPFFCDACEDKVTLGLELSKRKEELELSLNGIQANVRASLISRSEGVSSMSENKEDGNGTRHHQEKMLLMNICERIKASEKVDDFGLGIGIITNPRTIKDHVEEIVSVVYESVEKAGAAVDEGIRDVEDALDVEEIVQDPEGFLGDDFVETENNTSTHIISNPGAFRRQVEAGLGHNAIRRFTRRNNISTGTEEKTGKPNAKILEVDPKKMPQIPLYKTWKEKRSEILRMGKKGKRETHGRLQQRRNRPDAMKRLLRETFQELQRNQSDVQRKPRYSPEKWAQKVGTKNPSRRIAQRKK